MPPGSDVRPGLKLGLGSGEKESSLVIYSGLKVLDEFRGPCCDVILINLGGKSLVA